MIRVSRTTIELFGLSIRWYGLLIVTGIALAVWLAAAREKRYGLPKDTAVDVALLCVPAAILGARLYYVAFSWRDFAGGPWWRIFAVWEGGLAIYGGLIAAFLAGWFYGRAKKLSFLTLADLAAPCIALGQAIGRWGNFANQEAHGGPVLNETLKFFPAAVRIGENWYYATFFYESAWCALIVIALLVAERKWTGRQRGDIFFAYVFLYGLERAVVEGLRTDSLYWGTIRVSQALSLLAVLAVALVWAARSKNAPQWLRILAPVSALAAIAAGGVFGNVGTLIAAVITLVIAALMRFWNPDTRKNENWRE